MIGHTGQLDALRASHHRRTCRPPADHPAVVRYDCPRKDKHWSTKTMVTKKRLSHNTHHTKPEAQNRPKRRSNFYHPYHTVCSKYCRCLLRFFYVRRSTKNCNNSSIALLPLIPTRCSILVQQLFVTLGTYLTGVHVLASTYFPWF